jgi:PAS domain S-box-containing protein
MNTYAKILITTLPLVFFFLAATVGTTYYFSHRALTQLTETWLETRLAEAMQVITEQEDILHRYGLESIAASIAKAKLDAGGAIASIEVGELGFIFAVDSNGMIVMHPDREMIGMDVNREAWFQGMNTRKGRLTFTDRRGKSLAIYDYFKPWGWYVLATDPEKEVYGVADRMKPYLIYIGILGAAIMAIALMLLTRRLTGSLRQLTDGADRIGRGDLKTRIAIRSQDEFGQLAAVFNQMATQLQDNLTTLQHREEHFRSLIENTSDIITIVDADGVIQYESPAMERILGFTREEMVGRRAFDFFHPEDRERMKRLFKRRVRSHGVAPSVEIRHRHRDGSWRTLEATSKNMLHHPAVAGIVVNSRDVSKRKLAENRLHKSHQELEQRVAERTAELVRANARMQKEIEERKQAEAALRTNEQRMRAILRASPVGIGLTVKHQLEWANEAMYRMVGYEKDSLMGKSPKLLYPSLEEYLRVEKALYAHGDRTEIGQVETQWVRADGSLIDCIIRACSLDPDDPSGEQIVAVTDISDAKLLEAKLQQAKKMEAIGTLAGGVAHDLNNILSGITSYPELLLLELPPESPLRKPIQTIKKSGERAAIIVQDLLTMARRGVAVTEVVNMNQVIAEQLKSPEFKSLKTFHPDVRIAIDFATDLLNIKGSLTHLSKCIMNLASNAAEAMPDGGRMSITTRNIYIDRPIKGIEHVEAGDYVAVSISDTGMGISDADMERIFEPFYTKKKMGRSGTGLGMAVVWGTVKDHCGYIDVQSHEGQGSTFTLYLPATRDELLLKRAPMALDMIKGSGESVLVVDDSDVQREIAESLLSKLGYTVTAIASGEEAITYLKKRSADLLVLDMIMDPGIDGLETYRRIVEFKPYQKVIIASGYSETKRVKEAQKLGAGKYIKKPYSMETMGVAAKEALGN